eukprot:1160679-Pelagomonas_calceolata.AAC.8
MFASLHSCVQARHAACGGSRHLGGCSLPNHTVSGGLRVAEGFLLAQGLTAAKGFTVAKKPTIEAPHGSLQPTSGYHKHEWSADSTSTRSYVRAQRAQVGRQASLLGNALLSCAVAGLVGLAHSGSGSLATQLTAAQPSQLLMSHPATSAIRFE